MSSEGKSLKNENVFSKFFQRICFPFRTKKTRHSTRQYKSHLRHSSKNPKGFEANTYEAVLEQEGLLAPLFTESPVLNICLGFENSDFECGNQSLEEIYEKSSFWKPLMESNAIRSALAQRANGLEPMIDDIPASFWLECMEPTLNTLVSIQNMKRRRLNISKARQSPPSANIDSRIRHGDQEEVWQVGPPRLHTTRRLGIYGFLFPRNQPSVDRYFYDNARDLGVSIFLDLQSKQLYLLRDLVDLYVASASINCLKLFEIK
ncbi:hypothetical protein CHS0354_009990 [Potamilus streckersoni]|uniref:Uncharacterized protein n=1 Tax=Potamilus streckersoni TaxID=2493646 RepID=A0AAE0SCI8_9BIVA|nr:hypothetical protein CHS0354_009990 [Potamilus streckersoni]